MKKMFFEVYNSHFLFRMIHEVMKMREEEKKQSSRKLGLKRFFKKRWVFPAIYIGAGAILLSTFLWFQARDNNGAKEDEFGYETNSNRNLAGEDALEVNSPVEDFDWPVADEKNIEVVTYFYDPQGKEEEQEAAIISDGNSFYPSTGVALKAKDGKTFDVQAAMSGTVKTVKEDALLGNTVTVEHADNIVTVYQSLEEVTVKTGDKVKQGQKLGQAGRSLLNEEAGIHTHFEIRKDGVAVNPLEYFKKSLATLQDAEVKKSDNAVNGKAGEEAKKSDNAADGKIGEEAKKSDVKEEDSSQAESGEEKESQSDEDEKSDDETKDEN